MVISEGIGNEAIFLGVSILVGAGLFLLYDLLRIFRRIVVHGVIWVGMEDFLYWLVCTVIVFLMLYRENDGMIRGFALGGVLIGMLSYHFFFSRFVVKINVLLLQRLLRILRKIFLFFFGPVIKIGKKILFFFVKQLKKAWKAVKIGLCKL